MPISINRKLWYDGPNTLQTVIINTIAQKSFLINGEMGYLEDSSTPKKILRQQFAKQEKTGTIISDNPILIYKGLVNDPRNSQTSWIKTSTYLFIVNELSEASG